MSSEIVGRVTKETQEVQIHTAPDGVRTTVQDTWSITNADRQYLRRVYDRTGLRPFAVGRDGAEATIDDIRAVVSELMADGVDLAKPRGENQ